MPPMGEYADFADCVAKNGDKKDPEAYCSVIMRAIEGDAKDAGKRGKGTKGKAFIPCSFKEREGLVVGYANTPVIDAGDAQYRDLIPAELWMKALSAFFRCGAKINLLHRPIIVGETVSVELRPGAGPLLVSKPTQAWAKAMIDDGVLQGYSIEYIVYDFDVEESPDDDPRPIRKFLDFDVLRVSYVDEPMNPGSYFFGGKAMDNYQFVFDRRANRVTVEAVDDEAMAKLAALFDTGLKAAGVPDGARLGSIEIKVAAHGNDDAQPADTAIGESTVKAALARILGGGGKEELVDRKVDAAAEIKALKERIDALEQALEDGSKAAEGDDGMSDRLKAIEAKLQDVDLDTLGKVEALLPQDGEPGVSDRLGALEEAQGEGKSAVEQVQDQIARLVTYLEKERPADNSKGIQPVGPQMKSDEDFWGGAVALPLG